MASHIGGDSHCPLDWRLARIEVRTVRLANGLTVVAHHDPKAPLVAVYVAYRAGSRGEPPGKAGLAHLCEHLMYSGTPASPVSFFWPMEHAGATCMNAFVAEDYSAYFATLPADALDFALRMEADRMAHLGPALTREKIEREREVVRNELRQRRTEHGDAGAIIAALSHPRGHPYSHPPDGLDADLDNISESDVRAWIAGRHTGANAIVVIAGDVEPGAAIGKAQRYFDSVPAGMEADSEFGDVTTVTSEPVAIAADAGTPQPRLYLAWPAPPFGASGYPALEAVVELLAGGYRSRLRQRIVERERLASGMTLEVRPRQLGSQILMSLAMRPGSRVDDVNAAIAAELEGIARAAFDAEELAALRMRMFAQIVRGIEPVGGRPSKSGALGLAMMLTGNPDMHNQRVTTLATAGNEEIALAARQWRAAQPASQALHSDVPC